jgi:PTS system galactitol-specific IIB component
MKKKRILVACGTGIATSTVIADRVKELCLKAGIDVHVEQVKIVEVAGKADDFDLIVASTKVPASVKTPSVSGVSYLSGVGIEKTEAEIIEKLKALG